MGSSTGVTCMYLVDSSTEPTVQLNLKLFHCYWQFYHKLWFKLNFSLRQMTSLWSGTRGCAARIAQICDQCIPGSLPSPPPLLSFFLSCSCESLGTRLDLYLHAINLTRPPQGSRFILQRCDCGYFYGGKLSNYFASMPFLLEEL